MPSTPSHDELPLPEWLGAWVGDMRVAFPTAAIHAVFSTQNKNRVEPAIAPLDIEVHAGLPVFLMPLRKWLPQQFESDLTTLLPASPESPNQAWVVAFQPQGSESQPHMPCVGCRVEGIRGPFRGEAVSGQLHIDGVTWPTWTPRSSS